MRLPRLFLLFASVLVAPSLALACGSVAKRGPFEAPRVMRASNAPDAVTITFLGHATFHITTPGGATAATDYSGDHSAPMPLDVATMNRAHSTHWTARPDPRIARVLQGWRDDGKPAQHDITVRDLRVRNVSTNIRGYDGSTTQPYGNSVFVFETAGLCIAHLGHLHHLLNDEDIAVLGQIDVVMAPLDGSWTLSAQDLATVIDRLRPRLVLAMHYWDDRTVRRFAAVVADRYTLRWNQGPTITLSRATLPEIPELLVLPGPHF
jgi:L-ascorbate metabolism protein UlaG (beta-lactamase superfamily)